MRITKTQFGELAPGQVIVGGIPGTSAAHSQARDVVIARMQLGTRTSQVDLARIAGPMPPGGEHIFSVTGDNNELVVDVEELSRAQLHGDELALRLGWAISFIDVYARKAAGPATPELNKCRAALAATTEAGPTRPTYDELLSALRRAGQALAFSAPTHKHYAEARERHALAQKTVTDMLLLAGASAAELEAVRGERGTATGDAPIDHAALLRKYVKHVTDCEGANYVDHIGDPLSEVEFTPEEAAELRRIDKELFGGDHA